MPIGEAHDCGDAQCIGGTLMLDLTNETDFMKATKIVEANLMEVVISAHRAVLDGRVEDGEKLFESAVDMIDDVDGTVVRVVLMSITDIAAGMLMRIIQLEGGDVPQPDLDDPGVAETFAKIDEFSADPSTGVRRERPPNRMGDDHEG